MDKKNISTSLAEIPVGKKAKIKGLSSNLSAKATLIGLGILAGDEIEVMNRGLFGGPIAFKHGQSNFFAIRKNEAQEIEVELL